MAKKVEECRSDFGRCAGGCRSPTPDEDRERRGCLWDCINGFIDCYNQAPDRGGRNVRGQRVTTRRRPRTGNDPDFGDLPLSEIRWLVRTIDAHDQLRASGQVRSRGKRRS